ncbi:hypothetical protein GH714_014656 [Hevea brasiliensis]|uniref:Uncharacterized protein n=1 Tax=Hevea brasiliensis TaxID=3981 RepID=A0A6A6KT16_HEVBR|nr:hypothetical protein GH714_014656 [Hevea brasiliensis]
MSPVPSASKSPANTQWLILTGHSTPHLATGANSDLPTPTSPNHSVSNCNTGQVVTASTYPSLNLSIDLSRYPLTSFHSNPAGQSDMCTHAMTLRPKTMQKHVINLVTKDTDYLKFEPKTYTQWFMSKIKGAFPVRDIGALLYFLGLEREIQFTIQAKTSTATNRKALTVEVHVQEQRHFVEDKDMNAGNPYPGSSVNNHHYILRQGFNNYGSDGGNSGKKSNQEECKNEGFGACSSPDDGWILLCWTNKEFVVDERYEAEKWSSRHLVGDHQEIDKHEENDNCCDHPTPRSKYGAVMIQVAKFSTSES